MSHLNELIEVLRPHGVDYIPMWQITTWDKKFNAVDRAKQPEVRKYEYLLASEIKDLNVNGGDVKLLTTNESDLWTTQLVADRTIYDAEIIAIPWGGNAIVQHYNGKFITSDNRIAIARNPKVLDMKFLYYFISNHLDVLATFYRGSGIKHPNMAKVLDWPVPVPPIEVQQEIVRILDSFTALEAELEAELEARKKQYEYYRHQMLVFGAEVQEAPLGDLAINLDQKRKPVTRDARTSGYIPYYGASGIVDYVSDYIFDGDYLLVSEDGANLLARTTPIAFSISGKAWVNNHAHVLEFATYVERRFVEIYLNSIDLTPYISGAAQPKLNKANLNRIPIPNPSIEEKERVVEVLDKFDALVNNLSSGLPAEITARRKQYEYYRDQLLTFKELAS